MFEGLVGSFQQHPMLRVSRGCFTFVDAEEISIETGDVVDKGAPLRCGATRDTGFRIVVIVDAPPVGGNLGDQILTAQQRLPERFR